MKLNLLEFPHHHHHRHNHKIRFKSCSSIFWRFFEPIRWIGKRLKGWTKVRDGGAHCGKLMTLFQRLDHQHPIFTFLFFLLFTTSHFYFSFLYTFDWTKVRTGVRSLSTDGCCVDSVNSG